MLLKTEWFPGSRIVTLGESNARQRFLLDDEVVILHALAPLFMLDDLPVEGVVRVADVLAQVRHVRLFAVLALQRLLSHNLLYFHQGVLLGVQCDGADSPGTSHRLGEVGLREYCFIQHAGRVVQNGGVQFVFAPVRDLRDVVEDVRVVRVCFPLGQSPVLFGHGEFGEHRAGQGHVVVGETTVLVPGQADVGVTLLQLVVNVGTGQVVGCVVQFLHPVAPHAHSLARLKTLENVSLLANELQRLLLVPPGNQPHPLLRLLNLHFLLILRHILLLRFRRPLLLLHDQLVIHCGSRLFLLLVSVYTLHLHVVALMVEIDFTHHVLLLQ